MKYTFSILGLLLSVSGFAQTLTDSIYLYRQTEKSINFSYQNATQLNATSIKRSGIAGLTYNSVNGHFRRVQEAENERTIQISTSGIATLGKFKASGSFNFLRNYQDSLAWSTKGTEIDAQPYYFASSKAGKFERTAYDIKGVLSYSLIENKLYLSSGLEYSFKSSTRSVDPRPGVDNFRLELKPEITYQINQNLIGFQLDWGYGLEEFNLSYKNRDYLANLGYKDRINYMIYGYGLIEIMQGTQSTVRNQKYKGIGLNYSGKFKKYDFQTNIGFKRWDDNNKFRTTNSVRDNLIGTFVMDDLKIDLLISKKGPKNIQQLSLNANTTKGEDKRVLYDAVNYRYSHQAVNAECLYRFDYQSKKSFEIGTSLYYELLKKDDVVSDHYVKTSRIEPGLNGSFYHKTSKDLFSITTGIAYTIPLKHSISVPILQETVFTRGVIYPDYTYASSTALRLSGKINYISNTLFKEFGVGFSAQSSYLMQLESGLNSENATFQPSDSRLRLNLAVNLYF